MDEILCRCRVPTADTLVLLEDLGSPDSLLSWDPKRVNPSAKTGGHVSMQQLLFGKMMTMAGMKNHSLKQTVQFVKQSLTSLIGRPNLIPKRPS